jgi:hypothetical protein
MLTAYFDDSGTHDASRIVLVAGVCGTEWQIASLDGLWREIIDNPMCGEKNPLERFHAYDCNNSIGDFLRWKRVETDYLWHQLQTAIINSGVSSYGVACVREDWDSLITGDARAIYGNAEQMCIKNCFVRAIRWAEQNTFDPMMTFVFDNRPSNVQKVAQVVSHAFETGRPGETPSIVGTAFLSSKEVRPLQAADLIAWELYQFANDIYDGTAKFGKPNRHQLRYLMGNMRVDAQFASHDSIKRTAEHIAAQDQVMIRAAANHFANFDPSNPDLSHLSGKPPS